MFNEFYNSVKEKFNRSWLKFLFKFTALGKLLNKDATPTPWKFFNTYLSSLRLNRLWFKSFIRSQDTYFFNKLVEALTALKQANIFNEENTSILLNTQPIQQAMLQGEMLTPENRHVIVNHIFVLNGALIPLLERRILTQENFNVVAQHAGLPFLASALSLLLQAGILTQENFNVVAQHADHPFFASALRLLLQAGLLTEANLNTLLRPDHASLLSVDAWYIWNRIPPYYLTQANFERLLTAARQDNPLDALRRAFDAIIWQDDDPLGGLDRIYRDAQGLNHAAQNFNNAQSTHTASVHKSVSESATKLMRNYGATLNLEATIKNIQTYVKGLPKKYTGSDKAKTEAIVKAAKTCMNRLTASDYHFTDTSGVSTRQLLALAFTAIHDDAKRIGTLEDAKALFIEGLYEIQRGYNIDEGGVDNGGQDYPICPAGTFNKIMEKLNGIHSDVEIYYITPQGANLKFPNLVIEQTLAYLNSIASPLTPIDYQQSKAIIDNMKTSDSLEPIWNEIKDKVRSEIWDEFHEAYGSNPEDQRFKDLMNSWYILETPKLSDIEKQLESSQGFQKLMDLQMRNLFSSSQSPIMARLHEHSLWANRQESPDAQKAFDMRFGLSIILTKQ